MSLLEGMQIMTVYYLPHHSVKKESPTLPIRIFKPGVHQAGRHVPGFLELFLCGHLYVCMFVCVCAPLRLLITSGVMWCDIDLT